MQYACITLKNKGAFLHSLWKNRTGTHLCILQVLLTCPALSPALCDAAYHAYVLALPVVKNDIVRISGCVLENCILASSATHFSVSIKVEPLTCFTYDLRHKMQ